MKKFRIVEENEAFFVEERSWVSLFMWRRWSRYGGSFGDEDILFKSVSDAVTAIIKSTTKPVKTIVWQL